MSNRARAEEYLKNCQLCKFFLTANGCARTECNYAHCLEDLQRRPKGWPYSQCHRWNDGDPKPPYEVMGLLAKYAFANPETKVNPDWFNHLCDKMTKFADDEGQRALMMMRPALRRSSSPDSRSSRWEHRPRSRSPRSRSRSSRRSNVVEPKQDQPKQGVSLGSSSSSQLRAPDPPPAPLVPEAYASDPAPKSWDEALERIGESILGCAYNQCEVRRSISMSVLMARGREVEVYLSGYDEFNLIPPNGEWGDITIIRSSHVNSWEPWQGKLPDFPYKGFAVAPSLRYFRNLRHCFRMVGFKFPGALQNASFQPCPGS